MERIQQFDGLRGILAIWVILFHLDESMINGAIANNYIVELGCISVDVFFGLSGFVISLIYVEKKIFFSTFMKKRLRRLYPMLFFSTTIYLGFYLLKYLVNGLNVESQLFIDYFRSVFFINSTNFFTNENYLGLNFPSWSVSVEIILYVIFGIIVLLIRKLSPLRVMFILSIFCALILIYNDVFFEPGYGVFRGGLSFSVGMSVYAIDKNIEFKWLYKNILTRFANLMMITFLLYLIHNYKDGGLNVIFVPLLVFLILHGVLHEKGVVYKLLISCPFQYLGKISYSMYLNHSLFLAIIPFMYFDLLKTPVNQLTLFISGVSIILSTIIWSQFTCRYIENILRKPREYN